MGLFGKTIIDWDEYREDIIFYRWHGKEIKKNSTLILHPGQAAIFWCRGEMTGIYSDPGEFKLSSTIVPSGDDMNLLFVNTNQITMQWGTKNPVIVPFQTIPGGVPIRGFGTYLLKVDDIGQVIGHLPTMKGQYTTDDIRIKVDSILDTLIMKWISKEGKDLVNLQLQSEAICKGICEDLDMEMLKIGLTVSQFRCNSFSYPRELQSQLASAATATMVQQAENARRTASGSGTGSMNTSYAGTGTKSASAAANTSTQTYPNMAGVRFCIHCGEKTTPGAKFCIKCGRPL